ncbi:MAG: sulfatase-like hydrolase/transferase [Myxococcota bacterium]
MWPLLLTAGCAPDLSFLDRPPAPVPAGTPAVPLARAEQPATFALPPSSRPEGSPAPSEFGLIGPFELAEHRPRFDLWRTPLPIQPSLMPSASGGTHRFGSKPPRGMVVTGPQGPVRFERDARGAYSWGFDEDWLYLGLPKGDPAPDAKGFRIRFPRATQTEDRLNFATAELDAEAFARRTMTIGGESHTGLFLPAPATATFPLTLPEQATLAFDARILQPAVRDRTTSDGAEVVVEVRTSGEVHEVHRERVRLGHDTDTVRVDLSAWSGQAVDLVLRTEPVGTATYDYVLLGAPTVYPGGRTGRRVIVVFVDTMRTDHLGFMGYDRPITPNLDRLASHATVFEQAHTVAPWTLPSARAALSGQEPELWETAHTLAETFGAAGWRTDAVVSNAFLSQPFEVHRGFDRYDFEHLRRGRDVVRLGRRALREAEGRDELLLVHFMEPHIPYQEPWYWQHALAGSRPAALQSITRSFLTELKRDDPGFAGIRDYVTDRYDTQIWYVDTLLAPLLAEAGPDATVVLFSDHGEELWDHGGFEHSHAFWEELLHVPFVIRSPDLPARRVAAPVSLLDLTPTLEDLFGLPVDEGLPGRSLAPVARGEPGAAKALAARPLAFGRPLYDGDGWGVYADGRKWWDRDGTQALYDLGADPGEQRDLSRKARALSRWPARLGDALDRDVLRVWRLDLRAENVPYDIDLVVTQPEGIARAWLGCDPRGRAADLDPRVEGGRLVLHVPADVDPPQSVYLVPEGDPLDPRGLTVSYAAGPVRLAARADGDLVHDGPDPGTILSAGDENFGFDVRPTWTPEPVGVAVPGFHPEMEAQLRELGYLDPDPP